MGFFTEIEETILLGPNWATENTSFWERLLFFRDTGIWPSLHSRETLTLHMQNDIERERADGKIFCANQKTTRSKSMGIKIG